MSNPNKKHAKQSYTNKSVRLSHSSKWLPTWTRCYPDEGQPINMGPEGKIEFDLIWDALVTSAKGQWYELLLTLSDGSHPVIWVHEIWVLGLE